MFDNSKEIFEFPWEIKMKNLSKKSTFNGGYIGKLPTLPLYESVCIDDLLQPGSVETFADIFWPKGNHEFWYVTSSNILYLSILFSLVTL